MVQYDDSNALELSLRNPMNAPDNLQDLINIIDIV
jgi:hypothetical protein